MRSYVLEANPSNWASQNMIGLQCWESTWDKAFMKTKPYTHYAKKKKYIYVYKKWHLVTQINTTAAQIFK